MRVLVAPTGSRGDFQPLLALSIGLRDAGHEVVLASSPNFGDEARSFGLDFRAVGPDVRKIIEDGRVHMTPLRATFALLLIGRREFGSSVAQHIPLARNADIVVGGGAQIGAPTAAEVAGIPYYYVAYTPQALPSSHHPPFLLPFSNMPKPVNRLLWHACLQLVVAGVQGPLAEARRAAGLPPLRDFAEHFIPPDRTLIASDPEVAPLPPDLDPNIPVTGSLSLRDERPLPESLERFLAAGPAPIYIGFGSMPDPRPKQTTRLLIDAAKKTNRRLVLSTGWGGFGGAEQDDGVFTAGPVSHHVLFPRMAAIVHHGGAGTTAAAARAGVPQIVVPHAFDQFQSAANVYRARLGPEPLPRKRLTVRRLAQAIAEATSEEFREPASRAGTAIRARDGVGNAIKVLERVGGRS